jgi:hypothetical protein
MSEVASRTLQQSRVLGGGILPDDAALRERVLAPYREHCRYLRSVEVCPGADSVSATGEFAVGESYYIDSTGHFNAVEYNICYNQAAYYLLAQVARHRLLPVFENWTLDDFWQRQLADVLIVEYSVTFSRQIDPAGFSGELTFGRSWSQPATPVSPPLVAIETKCEFWDATGGRCQGRALLAVTNTPDQER